MSNYNLAEDVEDLTEEVAKLITSSNKRGRDIVELRESNNEIVELLREMRTVASKDVIGRLQREIEAAVTPEEVAEGLGDIEKMVQDVVLTVDREKGNGEQRYKEIGNALSILSEREERERRKIETTLKEEVESRVSIPLESLKKDISIVENSVREGVETLRGEVYSKVESTFRDEVSIPLESLKKDISLLENTLTQKVVSLKQEIATHGKEVEAISSSLSSFREGVTSTLPSLITEETLTLRLDSYPTEERIQELMECRITEEKVLSLLEALPSPNEKIEELASLLQGTVTRAEVVEMLEEYYIPPPPATPVVIPLLPESLPSPPVPTATPTIEQFTALQDQFTAVQQQVSLLSSLLPTTLTFSASANAVLKYMKVGDNHFLLSTGFPLDQDLVTFHLTSIPLPEPSTLTLSTKEYSTSLTSTGLLLFQRKGDTVQHVKRFMFWW